MISGKRRPQQGSLETQSPMLSSIWGRRFGIAFVMLWLMVFLIQSFDLDVLLRVNAKEAVGWIRVAQIETPIGYGDTSLHWVEGVVFQPLQGTTQQFERGQFTNQLFDRMKTAIDLAGINRDGYYPRRSRPNSRLPEAFDSNPGTLSPREMACRLHYAGWGRKRVYQFEVLSPKDIPFSQR